MTRTRVAILPVLMNFLVACTGEITDSGSISPPGQPGPGGAGAPNTPAPGATGTAPATPGGPAAPTIPTVPGMMPGDNNPIPTPQADGSLPYEPPMPASPALPARTWLLTPEEYGRAARSVLGVAVDVSDMDPVPDNGLYPNMSGSGLVRVPQADLYLQKAEAATLVLTEQQLRTATGCTTLQASCKSTFLQTAIQKAFRRPATADDITRYGEVFDIGATTMDAALPFRLVLKGLLNSPQFLYRTEIGAAADETKPAFNLTDYEIATLLSFSVLGEPPSDALFAAAGRGELSNLATLRTHVEAMIGASAAELQLNTFLLQWFKLHRFQEEIEKFENVFPGFLDVKAAMFEESRGFMARSGGLGGTIASLLTAPVPDPAGALGAFYRSDPSGAAGTARTGMLSLGAFLSSTAKQYLTSPTLRGLFIRDQLLCQHISLPDNFTPPPIEESEMRAPPKTTRELYETHASQPGCNSCHNLIDQIAYPFENFDGAGRFRTLEQYKSPSLTAPVAAAQAIDPRGMLLGTDVDGEYDNHTEIAQALARSNWVRECVARQAFRFYFGQTEAARGIPPVVEGTAALAGTGTLRDLVVALFSSSTTQQRARL